MGTRQNHHDAKDDHRHDIVGQTVDELPVNGLRFLSPQSSSHPAPVPDAGPELTYDRQ
jgi:hypothetical protein